MLALDTYLILMNSIPNGIFTCKGSPLLKPFAEFVNEDTVLAAIEENKNDENYDLLQRNLQQLKKMRLLNGKQLNIVELPMPDDVIYQDQRLPASYANFYIANQSVIVPAYRSDKDERVLDIIQECFPDRNVMGIDSTDIIWGLGSFHCLSQQEPEVEMRNKK